MQLDTRARKLTCLDCGPVTEANPLHARNGQLLSLKPTPPASEPGPEPAAAKPGTGSVQWREEAVKELKRLIATVQRVDGLKREAVVLRGALIAIGIEVPTIPWVSNGATKACALCSRMLNIHGEYRLRPGDREPICYRCVGRDIPIEPADSKGAT